jgi:hypothetical protein
MSYASGYSQASDMELDTKEILSLKKELYEIIQKLRTKHTIKFPR